MITTVHYNGLKRIATMATVPVTKEAAKIIKQHLCYLTVVYGDIRATKGNPHRVLRDCLTAIVKTTEIFQSNGYCFTDKNKATLAVINYFRKNSRVPNFADDFCKTPEEQMQSSLFKVSYGEHLVFGITPEYGAELREYLTNEYSALNDENLLYLKQHMQMFRVFYGDNCVRHPLWDMMERLSGYPRPDKPALRKKASSNKIQKILARISTR